MSLLSGSTYSEWIRGITNTRLLLIENNSSCRFELDGIGNEKVPIHSDKNFIEQVGNIFEEAHEHLSADQRQLVYASIEGAVVRLYSYAPPGHTSHVLPWSMIIRLKHSLRKNKLYRTESGSIYRPAVEILISDKTNSAQAEVLQRRCKTLSGRSYGLFWDAILFMGKTVLVMTRRLLRGEQVIAFYSAEDQSFYGSVYVRGQKSFVSILGHEQSAVLRGAQTLLPLLTGGE